MSRRPAPTAPALTLPELLVLSCAAQGGRLAAAGVVAARADTGRMYLTAAGGEWLAERMRQKQKGAGQ